MQLGFAHRSLEPEQQAVVEVGGVVNSIFVEDQGISQRTDLQKPAPIGRVTCQSRNLPTEHDAGFPQTHLSHQFLESFTIHRRGAGLTEIAVDDNDPLDRPA